MGEKVFLAKNSRAQCFIFLTAGICTFLVSLLCIFFVSLWIGVAVSILGGILLGFFIYFYRQLISNNLVYKNRIRVFKTL